MTTSPIDYQPSSHRRPRRIIARFVLAPLVAFGLVSLPLTPVTQTRSRVDAVTGSMEWQTTWPLGLTRGPTLDVSPLELRLKKMGTPWTRDWRFLHNTHRTVFGKAICYECGMAPPIYSFRPAIQYFVDASSDAQIKEFVRVMTIGTEAEQSAAVEAAADAAFEPRQTSPRAGVPSTAPAP